MSLQTHSLQLLSSSRKKQNLDKLRQWDLERAKSLQLFRKICDEIQEGLASKRQQARANAQGIRKATKDIDTILTNLQQPQSAIIRTAPSRLNPISQNIYPSLTSLLSKVQQQHQDHKKYTKKIKDKVEAVMTIVQDDQQLVPNSLIQPLTLVQMSVTAVQNSNTTLHTLCTQLLASYQSDKLAKCFNSSKDFHSLQLQFLDRAAWQQGCYSAYGESIRRVLEEEIKGQQGSVNRLKVVVGEWAAVVVEEVKGIHSSQRDRRNHNSQNDDSAQSGTVIYHNANQTNNHSIPLKTNKSISETNKNQNGSTNQNILPQSNSNHNNNMNSINQSLFQLPLLLSKQTQPMYLQFYYSPQQLLSKATLAQMSSAYGRHEKQMTVQWLITILKDGPLYPPFLDRSLLILKEYKCFIKHTVRPKETNSSNSTHSNDDSPNIIDDLGLSLSDEFLEKALMVISVDGFLVVYDHEWEPILEETNSKNLKRSRKDEIISMTIKKGRQSTNHLRNGTNSNNSGSLAYVMNDDEQVGTPPVLPASYLFKLNQHIGLEKMGDIGLKVREGGSPNALHNLINMTSGGHSTTTIQSSHMSSTSSSGLSLNSSSSSWKWPSMSSEPKKQIEVVLSSEDLREEVCQFIKQIVSG